MPQAEEKHDWDRAHRSTVLIAAVSLIVGTAGLVLAIVTYRHESSLDTRRLNVTVTDMIAGCPVNDPLFVDVINTGFQPVGIRQIEFEELGREIVVERPAKIIQSTKLGDAIRLKSLPVEPGELTLTIEPGASHEFIYSVEALAAHHARRVIVVDEDGKAFMVDLRSALGHLPEIAGCSSS
jgi:hypothetical protein